MFPLGTFPDDKRALVASVHSNLADLRDNPSSLNIQAINQRLQQCFDLIKTLHYHDGTEHWYCRRAPPEAQEFATFLIRYHAYKEKGAAPEWKESLWRVLKGCPDCVKAYLEARNRSDESYLSQYHESKVKDMNDKADQAETEAIVKAVKRSATAVDTTLNSAPTAIIYHALANIRITQKREIRDLFEERTPVSPFPSWPDFPAGLFLLLADSSERIRAWARRQAEACGPLSRLTSNSPHAAAVSALTRRLQLSDTQLSSSVSSSLNSGSSIDLSSVLPPPRLWGAFPTILGVVLAVEDGLSLIARVSKVDLAQLVLNQLSANAPNFKQVLECFVILLQRLGDKLWTDRPPDFHENKIDALCNNQAFELLLTQDPDPRKCLEWFEPYLRSLWTATSITFGDALDKMMQFLCVKLQHTRFDPTLRSQVSLTLASILVNLYNTALQQPNGRHLHALCYRTSSHHQLICNIAFGRLYKDSPWKEPRKAFRKFLSLALASDGRKASNLVFKLTIVTRAGEKANRTDLGSIGFRFHGPIWKQLYEVFPKQDPDAMALLINVVAASAHLDLLNPEIYTSRARAASAKDLKDAYAEEVKAHRNALETMRKGFQDAVTTFASDTGLVRTLLEQEGVVENLMAVMFSPSESLSSSAQEIAMQAWDVDGRDGSLRAYFEKHTAAAFKGTMTFLKTAKETVKGSLEACAVSRSTVLCLTDINDALCSKPDGLLFQIGFGKNSEIELPASIIGLWDLMSDVISEIFQRTPVWATYFDDSAIMIVWMRDALIFARDMVSKFNVFHDAAAETLQLSFTGASPVKSRGRTSPGQSMVKKLEDVITDAVRWLKLTDEELLHQTVELVKLILRCFERLAAKPPQAVVQKLEAYCADRTTTKHELNREQVSGIAEAIEPFLDEEETKKLTKHREQPSDKAIEISDSSEDEEVQLVGERKPPRPAPTRKPEPSKPKPDVYSQLMRAASSKDHGKEKVHLDLTPRTTSSSASRPFFTSAGPARSNFPPKGSGKPTNLAKMRELWKEAGAKAREIQAAANQQAQVPIAGPSRGHQSDASSRSRGSAAESSEDNASSEDEEERGLGALAKLQKLKGKVPTINKQERRGIQLMDNAIRNPARERLTAREQAKRTQMRLKPDLTPLHQMILSWNYDHNGEDPPNLEQLRLRGIPDLFSSYDDYRNVFHPLLSLECWSQIVKAKEEPQDSVNCSIAQKMFVDNWLDMELAILSQTEKGWYLAETDIVVLRPVKDPGVSLLAKIQSFRRNPQGFGTSVRCIPSPNQGGFANGSVCTLTKVFSLSTVNREYGALMSAPYYDLFDEIARPSPTKLPRISQQQVQKAMQAYKLNEPQATAILGSLDLEGFALIQGPPGTGKTSTICGLAGEFLSRRTTPPTPVQPGKPSSAPISAKLLICAPSNAAIDEVAKRLRDGIRDSRGNPLVPKVVRIGTDASINVGVKDIALDALVEAKMNLQPNQPKSDLGEEIDRINRQLTEITTRLKQISTELATTLGVDEDPKRLALDGEKKTLDSKRRNLNSLRNQARDKQTDNNRALDASRRKFRQEVLREADILCSTLSGSGHDTLEEFDFETVIIDEAAQSVELSSLIPLKYRYPQQLAPTVLSTRAKSFKYEQSLFARIQKHRPDAVYLLSIQYRMHPNISVLPSKVFYDGRLKDGPSMDVKTAQPWHRDQLFPPYRFFNVPQGREESARGGGHTLINRMEVSIAVALYDRLTKQYSRSGELDGRVGIIAMYRGQMLEIKRQLTDRFGRSVLSKLDVNTVDGFQGQEKDVIILSCIRAGPGVTSVGFLADVRRMNVGLTRSRSSLYILGHAATLERSETVWRKIVADAKERDCFLDDTTLATFSTPFSAIRKPSITSTPKLPPKSANPHARADILTPGQMRAASSGKVEVAPEQESESHNVAMKRKRSPEPEQSRTRPEPPSISRQEFAQPGPSTNRMDIDSDAPTVPAAPPLGPPSAKPKLLPPRPRPKQDPANALFIPRAPKGKMPRQVDRMRNEELPPNFSGHPGDESWPTI
ncbi:DEAD-box type RNA helicase [Tulasnella sp. 427]|nr:DEAD-box type RNA helicase [Tulasnella sp. 427]